ncbi:hypothetical protein C7U57_20140 [Pseudomonas sp. R9.37]|nr:hypothetical protein C7U57_20140 [Pseudomonas sp. R9.37]
MWERACARTQCVSHQIHQLTLRLRGQARSHIWVRYSLRSVFRLRCCRCALLFETCPCVT